MLCYDSRTDCTSCPSAASLDGSSLCSCAANTTSFHSGCDAHTETLVLGHNTLARGLGKTFGGYAMETWACCTPGSSGTGSYATGATGNFLFRLGPDLPAATFHARAPGPLLYQHRAAGYWPIWGSDDLKFGFGGALGTNGFCNRLHEPGRVHLRRPRTRGVRRQSSQLGPDGDGSVGPSGVSGKTGAEARLALYFHRSLTTTTSAAAQELQQHSSHTSAPSPPTGRPVTGRATPYGLGGPDMTRISMVSMPGNRGAWILNADGAVRNTARMRELQHCCHPQKPALGAEWQWVARPCRCCRCRARSTEGARPRCSERRSPLRC